MSEPEETEDLLRMLDELGDEVKQDVVVLDALSEDKENTLEINETPLAEVHRLMPQRPRAQQFVVEVEVSERRDARPPYQGAVAAKGRTDQFLANFGWDG